MDILQTRKTVAIHVSRVIGRYGFTSNDRDDLAQELLFLIIQRAHRFDPKVASWQTFSSRLIANGIKGLIRYQLAIKRDFRACTLFGDHLIPERTAPDGHDTLAGTRPEDLILRIDVGRALLKLEPRTRRLAQLLMSETVTDAARLLSISRATAYRYLRIIRHAFEDARLQQSSSMESRFRSGGGS